MKIKETTGWNARREETHGWNKRRHLWIQADGGRKKSILLTWNVFTLEARYWLRAQVASQKKFPPSMYKPAANDLTLSSLFLYSYQSVVFFLSTNFKRSSFAFAHKRKSPQTSNVPRSARTKALETVDRKRINGPISLSRQRPETGVMKMGSGRGAVSAERKKKSA